MERSGAALHIADRFSRVKPQQQGPDYLLELLVDVETRSCW